MGKCLSKKSKKQIPSTQNDNNEKSLGKSPSKNSNNEDKKISLVQSIQKELLLQMENDVNENETVREMPSSSKKQNTFKSVKSEPLISSRPEKTISHKVGSEIILQFPIFSDNSEFQKQKSHEKNEFSQNNLDEFYDTRDFFGVSQESLGFPVLALENLEHNPTLISRNKVNLIEIMARTLDIEKWICFYDFDDISQTNLAILYIFKDELYELRKKIFEKLLNHELPHIIQVFEVQTSKQRNIFWEERVIQAAICEYSRANLLQIIEKRASAKAYYSEAEILGFLECALMALSFLKKLEIAHLSISTESFIYSESYKISGFGQVFLTEFDNKQTLIQINSDEKKQQEKFIAPELLKILFSQEEDKKEVIDPYKCDIFSLGIVIIDMLYLANTPLEYCKLSNLQRFLEEPFSKKYPTVIYLLKKMLVLDVSERCDVDSLLEMFKNNDKNEIDERKFIGKEKKFNPKQIGQINPLIFQKDYLTKDETREKIKEFFHKGLVLSFLEKPNISLEFLMKCIKFERFSTLLPPGEIFDVYYNIGLSSERLELYDDAYENCEKAENFLKKIQNINLKTFNFEDTVFSEQSSPIHSRFSVNFKSTTPQNITPQSFSPMNRQRNTPFNDDPKNLNKNLEEIQTFKHLAVLYHLAFCCYKLKELDKAKTYLNEIWSLLNLAKDVAQQYLCDYFDLCGLVYFYLNKFKLAIKFFNILQEKAIINKEKALIQKAKLQYDSGNYLEAWDLFNQIVLSYDSKEKITDEKDFPTHMFLSFGYLLLITELTKDKKEFFYCLERVQNFWKEFAQKEDNSPEFIKLILDWILRFSPYLELFPDEKMYFVKVVLKSIQTNLSEYPQKEFLLYALYCLAKAYIRLDSKEDALECLEKAEKIAIGLLKSNKYSFQCTLIFYCAIDVLICLETISKEHNSIDILNENCEKLIQKYRISKGFLLYFKAIKIKIINEKNENPVFYEKELGNLELMIKENEKDANNNDSFFRYYQPLTQFHELRLLHFLKQEQAQEAKKVIDDIVREWIEFDHKNQENEKAVVMLDDYSELKRIAIEESYRFFCEISWFYEKITLQFIQHGYLQNAKVLLMILKAYYFKKNLIEKHHVKNNTDNYHFVLPNGEHYIELYNLISFVCFSLNSFIEGFEYLVKAYELCEKTWKNELQPKRLEKTLINLTFSMSQKYHVQGDYEKALNVLLSKKMVFERKNHEILDIYYNVIILLRIQNFYYDEACETINFLLKIYSDKYEKSQRFENFLKIIKLELYNLEILFEKGFLEEGEAILLTLMRKINEIYKNGIHKSEMENDLELKKNYQKIIGKYYLFIQDYEKSTFHFKKSYNISQQIHGRNSIFTQEINNLLVESLINLGKTQEASDIFHEISVEKSNENALSKEVLASAIRKKVEGKLFLHLEKPDKALEEFDQCLNILGERSLENTKSSLKFNFVIQSDKKQSISKEDSKKSSKYKIFLLADIMLNKARAYLMKTNKDEGENCLNKSFELFQELLNDNQFKHPLLIEIMLEIIRERMKRYKIVSYFQIIKKLEKFLPEEKTLFIDMFGHRKNEIQMIRIFEKYTKDKNEESLEESLRNILKQKTEQNQKNFAEPKKFKSYLVNRKDEIDETKEIIRKTYFMCISLYKNYKDNYFLKESINYFKMSNEL